MVEGNGDLHILILSVAIAVSQQHHLVVVGEVIVGYGDGGGAMDGVDQPIPAIREGAVVDPHVAPSEDGDAVSVRHGPVPVVLGGVPDVGVPPLLAVVDVEAVDNDVRHVLHGEAGPAGYVHAGPPPVDRLERVEHQLLLEPDRHVPGEGDPQGLVLDGPVPQGARLRVDRVVARVGHHVDLPVPSPDRMFAEPNRAICQTLAVLLPVRVAPPAVVDWVACPAGQETQVPP